MPHAEKQKSERGHYSKWNLRKSREFGMKNTTEKVDLSDCTVQNGKHY
jgi:hypothetical protein